MAKHEITIHENTGATKESAPYLGTYVSKGTLLLAGYIDAIATDCGLSAIQAEAMLTGAFDAIVELEKDGLVRVNTDLGAFCGVITGSFATSDAAFNPAVNSLDLVLRLDDDLKNLLADVTPSIVTDETTTKVRLDNVADEAMPRPYNVIHGLNVFRAAGINLITTDTGYEAYLMDSLGVKYPVRLVEAVSPQLVRVKSQTLLDGGDYKFYMVSRGGDAEGPLQSVFRKVKVLKIEPTVPTACKCGKTEETVTSGKTNSIEGFCLTADWSKETNYLIAHYKTKNMPAEEMCQLSGTAIKSAECTDKKIVFDLATIYMAIVSAGYTIETGERFQIDVEAQLGSTTTDKVSFTGIGA